MTQDDIIAMARDVGLGTERWTTEEEFHDFLERFAWIITAHEREACAKLVETTHAQGLQSIREACAAAIRARGK